MKKFNLIIIAAILFTACDYNGKNFPDYGYRPTDLKTLDYTLADADYKTIADNKGNQAIAEENGELTELKALATSKAFSASLSAQNYVPALLASLYPTADPKSAVRVTYNYRVGSSGFYKLSADDYTQIWGGVSTVGALTPSKSANSSLPVVLAKQFPAAKEGDAKITEYEYSKTEPSMQETTITAFFDNFESYGTNVAVPTTNFLLNTDVKDAKVWECRTFNNNKYAQISSNNSGAENEVWLITKKIDLTGATDNAEFTFDVTAGYFNAEILSILVSENFDGTKAGIATAAWTDISSNFTIPAEPASGYGVLGSAGVMDFSDYAGKNVYIAFKYNGNGIGNVATTTYQIDNVKVTYTAMSSVVNEKETRFAYVKYANGKWAVDVAKSIYQLTADDYAAMGKTSLTAAEAKNYLPVLLQQKYPYAQQGDVKVLVYKTSATANYADEYIYKNNIWAPLSFIETRTEQFIKGTSGKWVFDPTVRYTMVRADYQLMVDYVLNHPVLYVYKRGSYTNEEWYYGFNAYYDNISLRTSGSVTSSRDVPCSVENDTELHSLATDEEKFELLWRRLCYEGMIIYLQLKYPNAVAEVSGITVEYHITAKVYYGPTSNDTKMHEFQYKTLTSGTPDTPPTFEFIDVIEK